MTSQPKRILFLTGTRADFGKMKSLMQWVQVEPGFESVVFVTGMHTLKRYGNTIEEVRNAGIRNVHEFINQGSHDPMELVLSNTIQGLSRYVQENQVDMLIVHGDRVEALAGSIVGLLRNIRVCHIEGGELSGTVDDMIRHSVSKLSHIHLVANDDAARRLCAMGEQPDHVFVIGSPDIDIMLSDQLPTLDTVVRHYELPFSEYAIVMFHSVTTDIENMSRNAHELVAALLETRQNYIVIYPNNDAGTEHIFEAYRLLEGHPRFRMYPSLRFEYFLTLLRHSQFVIGNSSAGIREAPVYGVPTINIGSRQRQRLKHESIYDVACEKTAIQDAVNQALRCPRFTPKLHFGTGDSLNKFKHLILQPYLWELPVQKRFYDAVTANDKKPVCTTSE